MSWFDQTIQLCPRLRRRARIAVGVAGMLWMAVAHGATEAPALSESQVKALFLFNFAKYVDWPQDAFASDDAPIVIGLVGQESFEDALKQVVGGKNVNGRSVVVKQVASTNEYRNCHILFIGASEKEHIREILGAVKDLPVLTVGETEDFLSQDGMIGVGKKANRIRLQINLILCRPSGRS